MDHADENGFADPRALPRSSRRDTDPLEQRLDRWVSAGRQFVDGVSGARPGSRGGGRSAAGRSGDRPGAAGFRAADIGRWVESKLDRLLEDDGDDWREPWQEPPSMAPARRRPLEAISRRGSARPPAPAAAASPAPAAAPGDDWPDDEAFTVPRWRRPAVAPRGLDVPPSSPQPPSSSPSPPPSTPSRPLPRSTRRR